MIQFSDHLQWPDLVSDKSERSRHRTVFIVKPWYTFRKYSHNLIDIL